jgi:hypothetical protein
MTKEPPIDTLINALIKASDPMRDSENSGMIHISKALELVRSWNDAKRCEISVIADDLVRLFVHPQGKHKQSDESIVRGVFNHLLPYLRTTGPVSVDLRDVRAAFAGIVALAGNPPVTRHAAIEIISVAEDMLNNHIPPLSEIEGQSS